MILADRRGMIRIAAGAALVPVLASRHARAAAGPARPISPPAGTMIYRRTLERELPGSASLTVKRGFAVRFEHVGRGFRLAGDQTSAEVSAPETLAVFARLEEQRVETGVFPLLLDGTGLIVEGPGERTRPDEVTQALQEAEARLGLQPGSPASENEVGQLVESLHQAGARMASQLPVDLFAPQLESRREEREIRLPWGDSGSVEIVFTASRNPATGLMRAASRAVTTRLLGDHRQSLERWELEAT